MNFWYEWVEPDFLMPPRFVIPFKVCKQCGYHISSFHHLLYDVPTCAKDFSLRFRVVRLNLGAKSTACALYVVHRVVFRQSHQRLAAVRTWYKSYNFPLSSLASSMTFRHLGD